MTRDMFELREVLEDAEHHLLRACGALEDAIDLEEPGTVVATLIEEAQRKRADAYNFVFHAFAEVVKRGGENNEHQ